MESPPESSGSQLLHSLNAVVNFLHTEGFYAAGGVARHCCADGLLLVGCGSRVTAAGTVWLPPSARPPSVYVPATPEVPGASLQSPPSLTAMCRPMLRRRHPAAEEVLLGEIENRYPAPDALSPRRGTAASQASSGSGGGRAAAADQQSLDAHPHQQHQRPHQHQDQQQHHHHHQWHQPQEHHAANHAVSEDSGSPGGSGGAAPTPPAVVDLQPALSGAAVLTPLATADSMESAEK